MRLLPGLCLIVQALLMVRCNAGWEDAPVTSRVLCHTDAGDMTIEVHRDWAPIGADHFVELVGASFFTDIAITMFEYIFLSCKFNSASSYPTLL